MTVELAIVVPTLNERENIRPLLDRLNSALTGIVWEVTFVDDDSLDGTAALLREIAQAEPRVRLVHRIGRRGLSSACIEGMMSCVAPYVAVMDGDLQHDARLLPRMLEELRRSDADIVVGSRYIGEGDSAGLSRTRRRLSQAATSVSRLVARSDLTDPMSGFFMLRRSFLDRCVRRLSGKGFKILLDLLSSAPGKVSYKELPYAFSPRQSGASKLDTLVVSEFFILLADKFLGHILPTRFLMFVAIGLIGAAAHVSILGLMIWSVGTGFLPAQATATFLAMTINFVLNNVFTHRDLRLKGRRFMIGLFSFYLACAIGAIMNVQVAGFLFAQNVPWWMAGVLGASIGSVWNYAVTSTFTWKRHARS